MKRRMLGCLALALLASAAQAQDPFVDDRPASVVRERTAEVEPALPQISPEMMTPELYLYLQELRRHDDPAQAVRRKAELRASQRMNRIAAMKWFGMSNARPQVSVTPMMGIYSPAWVGNGWDRYDWSAASQPSANVYIEANTIRR